MKKQLGTTPFFVCVLKKKFWAAAGCLILAAIMVVAVYNPLVVGAAAFQRELPIYCVNRDQKVCALTFDAAWGNVR